MMQPKSPQALEKCVSLVLTRARDQLQHPDPDQNLLGFIQQAELDAEKKINLKMNRWRPFLSDIQMTHLLWGCHHHYPEKSAQRFAMKQILATDTDTVFSSACNFFFFLRELRFWLCSCDASPD